MVLNSLDFEKSYTLKVYEHVHRNKSLDEMQLSLILVESHYLLKRWHILFVIKTFVFLVILLLIRTD